MTKPMKSPLDRSEYQEQVAIFKWSKRMESAYPCLELLFGSMMGVHLPVKALAKLKAAGMKKGKPDINLPVPRGGFCGLWIELKIKGNDATDEQERMCRHLSEEGNAVYKIFGAASSISIIESYIKGEIIKK